MSNDVRAWLGALLAAPIVITTCLMVTTGIVDRTAAADDRRPANVAEAAALGSEAELIRRLRLGEDPTHVYPIRAHVISPSVRLATALESALWARSFEMVRLLEKEGVLGDVRTRLELACLAEDLGLPDISTHLVNGEAFACRPEDGLARVIKRTGSAG